MKIELARPFVMALASAAMVLAVADAEFGGGLSDGLADLAAIGWSEDAPRVEPETCPGCSFDITFGGAVPVGVAVVFDLPRSTMEGRCDLLGPPVTCLPGSPCLLIGEYQITVVVQPGDVLTSAFTIPTGNPPIVLGAMSTVGDVTTLTTIVKEGEVVEIPCGEVLRMWSLRVTRGGVELPFDIYVKCWKCDN